MNVFFRELMSHRKSLFFWCVGMIFMVVSGVAKFYGYSTTGQSTVNQVLDLFPESMRVLFGLNGFDLSSPSGAYGILFMYLVLMAVVHAVLIGTDLISKEERDKTSEFLYVKPVSRTRVITAKLSAGFVNLVILNLVTLVSSLYTVDYFSKTNAAHSDVILLCGALFIMQLLFFLLGTAIAAVAKHAKAAAGMATTFILATFTLYFAINLNGNIDFLKYLTPFKYFEAQSILADGRLDVFYMGLTTVIIVVSLVVTYHQYNRRDLNI